MAQYACGSAEWFERLREIVADLIREAPSNELATPWVMSERYTDAPDRIANAGRDLTLTIRFQASGGGVEATYDPEADCQIKWDYQASTPITTLVTADQEDGFAALEGLLQELIVSGKARLEVRTPPPPYVGALLHDRIASRTRAG